MKKYILFLLPCLLLIGGGCSSSSDSTNNDYYDSYDSYDSYDYSDTENIPQGSATTLGCNLDTEYCASLDVYIEGNEVSSVFDNDNFEYVSVDYSVCDELGCVFHDWYGDQWYFEF
ncbi:MAG: hypothetical protein ACD_66C00018G0005 [uncultured bacterium]|uniref:Uncharacterized protein n=1 Tax=Candidatus Uhrbacteria bacterium GW2011_GWC1_41_20 TaxID=1618983 RepID=A0A0G0VGA7_9BACT|nr:MAG: hypothetical protein ACD_66C00018G0005 [uncultured bacterium]KKR23143.1 MAG: hypothetical protein UT52_C0002G0015 [Candidatus Uhrbacteria bacterium GW2011_GWE1_39_46]KKR64498.1 MAG: hypothetical protein UU04_C0001G0015 [Candidatus Uhrbacteria bacterium GW2011_GWC2_40_450]KKR90341.1 MAG: hypothetical protein UU36_C0007G0013 [Candidatus Uhrbacteria bacterium GW2011_GWE2_41_1153]KKR90570.1 MAG: hypothetical protein UU40_C0002G0015 [Candidatus Uhrbacteria bacterium GW2011_GWD2_41_121]KKR96